MELIKTLVFSLLIIIGIVSIGTTCLYIMYKFEKTKN